MNPCCSANKKGKTILNFHKLPLCNRFVKKINEKEYKKKLTLLGCPVCGLLRLKTVVPKNEILPKFKWLTYNEPTSHLENLKKEASNLFSKKNVFICGMTYKDDPLISKFGKSFKKYRIDPIKDMNLEISNVASEGIIPNFTKKNITKFLKKNKKPDLLIARHLLEHAPKMKLFLNKVKKFVKESGYIIFEVPDCSKQIKFNDYTMLWEEHMTYFTEETLKNFFKINYTKMTLVKFLRYKNSHEDVLIVILKNKAQDNNNAKDRFQIKNKTIFNYGEKFLKIKNNIHNNLEKLIKKHKNIFIFGVGHHSIIFVNTMKIGKFIKFAIDDNKFKQQLFMPGSKIKIKGVKDIYKDIYAKSLCLTTLSEKVLTKIKKIKEIKKNKIKFISIYPYQNNSIYKNI